jgi:hypothetical protein
MRLTAAILLLFVSPLVSGITFTVERGTASLPVEVDFSTVAESTSYIDHVLEVKGGSVAALFLGQQTQIVDAQVGPNPNQQWQYETLSTPTVSGPQLTLDLHPPGPPHQNLITFELAGNFLIGGVVNGPQNIFAGSGMGGSISVLFDVDQTQFGMSYFGYEDTTRSASIWFDFYARDGEHLGHAAYTPSVVTPTTPIDLRILVSAGAFAGLTITNSDPFGVGYDDFRFLAPAPPMAAFLLVAISVIRLFHPRFRVRHPAR